jgi:hypothetical protein
MDSKFMGVGDERSWYMYIVPRGWAHVVHEPRRARVARVSWFS